MSTIGGAFSETQLLQQRVKASEISFDDRIKQQFIPQFDVLKAIQAVQTATINASFQRKKEFDVEIMWENFCDITAEDCTGSCELGGNKSSTNVETKTLSCLKEVGFTMSENDFIDNEYDINVAKALLAADKSLVEAYAQYAVAQLESFRGTNVMGSSGKGVASGSDTAINPAYWNASLFPYLSRVAIMNKFTNPVLVSGSNLYEQSLLAAAVGGADYKLFGTFPIYHDLFNIDSVNDPNLKSYMLSMGSLAMVNKTFNPDVPEKLQDFTRYTMRSNFFPFLKYDVWYDNECESGTNRLVKHNWTLRLIADIYNNPAGCNQANTGVLSFICASS